MNEDTLIKMMKSLTEERVENLDCETRKLFDAVMSIADKRDELIEQNEKLKNQLYSNDQILVTCPNCKEEFLINECRVVADLQNRIDRVFDILDNNFDPWLEPQDWEKIYKIKKILKGVDENV